MTHEPIIAALNERLAAADEAGPADVLADAVALLRDAAILYDARDQPESAGLLRRLACELTPASSAGVAPATDQSALRDRIAEALYEVRRPGLGGLTEAEAVGRMADAVIAVLPAAADRAALLDEVIDRAFRYGESLSSIGDVRIAHGMAAELQRMRDEMPAVVLPASTGQTHPAAVLARVHEWVTGEVVTAKTEFGDGYRAAQRDIRDLMKGRFDADAANELRRAAAEPADETQAPCGRPSSIPTPCSADDHCCKGPTAGPAAGRQTKQEQP